MRTSFSGLRHPTPYFSASDEPMEVSPRSSLLLPNSTRNRKFSLNLPPALGDLPAPASCSFFLPLSAEPEATPGSTFPGATYPKLTCSCIFISWNLMNLEPRVCRYSRPPERLVWHSWLGHMIRGMKVGDWIWEARKESRRKRSPLPSQHFLLTVHTTNWKQGLDLS